MGRNLVDVLPLDDVILSVNSILNMRTKLMTQLKDSSDQIDSLRDLAIKFWSLSSTIGDCIIQVEHYYNESVVLYKMRFSKVISEPGSSAKEKENRANNDEEYLNLKYVDSQKISDYLNYLKNIRSDLDKAHYLAKEIYKTQVEEFIRTKTSNQ